MRTHRIFTTTTIMAAVLTRLRYIAVGLKYITYHVVIYTSKILNTDISKAFKMFLNITITNIPQQKLTVSSGQWGHGTIS